MFSRRSAILKYLLALCMGAVLYSEWFVYRLQHYRWIDLKCDEEDLSCTKILFVADPQIQGDKAVPFPLNSIFNWDSDSYLKSTFNAVTKHFKPDVIVYLGDLMDEGSISTMSQFHSYAKRLFNIFSTDLPVMQVWVPGDNDIGGENEPVRHDIVKEFNNVFVRPDIVSYKNIKFIEINAITHTMPNVAQDTINSFEFRIVVSHYPVTTRYVFGKQIHEKFRPHIYFCAHDHVSKYVKHTRELRNKEERSRDFGESSLDIKFDNVSVYEIYVPTCSYRMGTRNIGYGAAVLENNNQQMRYTVFWSPERFPYLICYLILAIVICLALIIRVLRMFVSVRTSISTDRLPLLKRI